MLRARAGAQRRGIETGGWAMQRRSLILLGSAAVIAMAGALLIKPPAPPAPPAGSGGLAFPDLAQRLSSAARIEVRRHLLDDAMLTIPATMWDRLYAELCIVGAHARALGSLSTAAEAA